jgi:hypothetical protein
VQLRPALLIFHRTFPLLFLPKISFSIFPFLVFEISDRCRQRSFTMQEFLPAPPKGLSGLFEPLGEVLGLPLLPQHMHEILFFLFLYDLIYTRISPSLSTSFFPKVYPKLTAKERIDWNVHVVSLTQCTLIGILAAFCLIFDQERRNMTWQERVWGYTGATNTLLGIANGYFVWHLLSMIKYFKLYGWSMVAHGVCALAIMISGFVSSISRTRTFSNKDSDFE